MPKGRGRVENGHENQAPGLERLRYNKLSSAGAGEWVGMGRRHAEKQRGSARMAYLERVPTE
jgi:hypothetical protein